MTEAELYESWGDLRAAFYAQASDEEAAEQAASEGWRPRTTQ